MQTVWGRWSRHVSGVFPDKDNKAQQGLSWMLRLSSHCFTLCCVNAFTVEKRLCCVNAPSCKSPRVICSCETRTGFSTFSRWVWDERCQKSPILCKCFFKQTNWWKGWMLNCFQLVSWKKCLGYFKTLNVFARALKCIFSLMRFGDAWLHVPAGKLAETRENLIGVGRNSFQDKINKVMFNVFFSASGNVLIGEVWLQLKKKCLIMGRSRTSPQPRPCATPAPWLAPPSRTRPLSTTALSPSHQTQRTRRKKTGPSASSWREEVIKVSHRTKYPQI